MSRFEWATESDTEYQCTRCGKAIKGEPIWIELSATNSTFYPDGIPTGHQSQGGFPFGPECAKRPNAEYTGCASDEWYSRKKR